MRSNFLGKRRKGVLILFLQLSIVEFAVSVETSSFLTNVLIKIQRERLGLLDNHVSTPENENMDNSMVHEDNTDYIYVNDVDDSMSGSNDHHLDPGKYDYTYNELEIGGETKVSPNYAKKNLSAPIHDGIYIYNDTIYLYKAPKKPNSNQHAHFNPMTSGIPLHNYKIVHKKPVKATSAQIDDTDPDALISLMMPEDGGMTEAPTPSSDHGDDEIAGYYYYYYPLDQIPPEFAEIVAKIMSKPARPIKPGMVIKPAKKPGGMTPMKPGGMMPMKMMKKPKQPVGPLFKAMALFVGTAVAFIVSILLLPRVKLVKAKNLGDIRTFSDLPEPGFDFF